ncbi:MAG: hypothetical protein AAF791_06175 [Bacteroidota bacterium]
MSDRDDWLERFEQAGALTRLGMLSGGAVRLAAQTLDRALDRAAAIAADAEDAFRKELDPNVSDATILDETDDSDR